MATPINEDLIRNVVAQVLAQVGRAPVVAGPRFTGRHGVFTCVDGAVAAAPPYKAGNTGFGRCRGEEGLDNCAT